MFGKSVSGTAMAMLVFAGPLHAAEDMGLRSDQARMGVRSAGLGAQIGVRVRLGGERVVHESQRLELAITAGPALRRSDGKGINGRILGLTTNPGYGARLSLVGSDLYMHRTHLGAAEDEKEQGDGKKPRKKQSTGDKIAWVAAVAGGVMVLLIGAAAIALASSGPGD